MFTSFDVPASAAAARDFLIGQGVPAPQLDECTRLMMGGNLSPYDLEEILSHARSAA